jgi:hypothetical protein
VWLYWSAKGIEWFDDVGDKLYRGALWWVWIFLLAKDIAVWCSIHLGTISALHAEITRCPSNYLVSLPVLVCKGHRVIWRRRKQIVPRCAVTGVANLVCKGHRVIRRRRRQIVPRCAVMGVAVLVYKGHRVIWRRRRQIVPRCAVIGVAVLICNGHWVIWCSTHLDTISALHAEITRCPSNYLVSLPVLVCKGHRVIWRRRRQIVPRCAVTGVANLVCKGHCGLM